MARSPGATLNALSAALFAAAGRPLDLLYSRLGGLNGRFFPAGWGNLSLIDLAADVELMKSWPPQDLQIEWRLLERSSWDGVPCKLYEGTFRTPCVRRIYDALPVASRTARVQLLLPAAGLGAAPHAGPPLFSQPHTAAAVLHLAATGDHGFSRRLRLGGPLLAQGVGTLVHESPYYGARRPSEQRGSKLCAVSDLLVLGWATILESLCLLHWAEQEGVQHRGICGLSMGGVHAAMTAGLYPRPAAVTPLLTPRSAAVAYCDGAFAPLLEWTALLGERDWADNEVEAVVAAAAQPVSLLQRARYVQLERLQQQLERVEESLCDVEEAHGAPPTPTPPACAMSDAVGSAGCTADVVAAEAAEEALAAVQQAAALAAVTEAAAAEEQQEEEAAAVAAAVSAAPTVVRQEDAWRREVRRRTTSPTPRSGLSRLSSVAGAQLPPPPDTFRRLRHVLETFTDVTRYPRCDLLSVCWSLSIFKPAAVLLPA